MSRFKNAFLFFTISLVLLSGCASEQEKKRAHLEKGNDYFNKKEYKSAKLEFKSAIQIDSKYAEAYSRLGETNLKLGDARGAFQALRCRQFR